MLIRIGDKVIDENHLAKKIKAILTLRAQGNSQQEVAEMMGIDRSFVSRLEAIGEIHRGRRIAVVGFPIANRSEVEKLLNEKGIEYCFLLNETQRWQYVKEKSGVDLLNEVMSLLAHLRTFDTVIIIGSNQRVKIIEALLDKQVISIELGPSPIQQDQVVSMQELRQVIEALKYTRDQEVKGINEKGS